MNTVQPAMYLEFHFLKGWGAEGGWKNISKRTFNTTSYKCIFYR